MTECTTTEWMRRKEAGAYCQSRGFPVSANYLRKLACIGGGPQFQYFGRVPMYKREWLDEWIASKLSDVTTNTVGRPTRR